MTTAFWRTLWAYAINSVGDEFYAVALPLVVLQLGYPASAATFLRTAVMAVAVAAGFLVGHVVDRRGPGRSLFGSYAGSVAVLALGVVCIFAGVDGYVAALFTAAALGLFAAVSAAAVDAGVPHLVGSPDQMRHGYSLLESARATATVVGPALGGFAVAVRSVPLVMLANAVTFAAATLITGRGRAFPMPERKADSAVRQIAEGLRAVVRNRPLRLGICLSLTINISLGAEQPLVLTRLVREFALPPVGISTVLVVVGLSSVAISLAVNRWAPAWPPRTAMLWGALVVGVSGLGLGAVPGAWTVGALYCLHAAATISYTVSWRSYRQSLVAPELLGRVSATCRSLAHSGVVLGTAAVGVLQSTGAGARALLIAGGVLCVAGVGAASVWLRRAGAHEADPAEASSAG